MRAASLGSGFGANPAAKAIEMLIGHTLDAQGHASLKRNDANRLPDIYDPAFIHADADLAQISAGLVQSKSGRLCLYGPPGTGKTAYGRWLAEELGVPLVVTESREGPKKLSLSLISSRQYCSLLIALLRAVNTWLSS